MTNENENTQGWAGAAADVIREHFPHAVRGACRTPNTPDALLTFVFGNDGYNGSDGRSRMEVELLRQRLDDAGIKEVELEASSDGRAWGMLVESWRVTEIRSWLWEAAAIAFAWSDAGATGAVVEENQRQQSSEAEHDIETQLDAIIWGTGML